MIQIKDKCDYFCNFGNFTAVEYFKTMGQRIRHFQVCFLIFAVLTPPKKCEHIYIFIQSFANQSLTVCVQINKQIIKREDRLFRAASACTGVVVSAGSMPLNTRGENKRLVLLLTGATYNECQP